MSAVLSSQTAAHSNLRVLPKSSHKVSRLLQQAGTGAAIALLLMLVGCAVDLLGGAMGGSLQAYGIASGLVIALVTLTLAQLAQHLN
jgi:hypothetical protein